MSLTRRDFLKYSAVAAAGASSVPIFKSAMAMGKKPEKVVSHVTTFCEMCFWNCGAIAKVENGKVVKLEGNPANAASKGKLCARGNAGMGSLYDPDRLKHPMLNTGKRGEPKWKKVSWDEALGFTAEKLKSIKEKYGPEAVALISHGSGGSFWKYILNAYGSPNYTAPSFAQCRGPRDIGYLLTFGDGPGSPEQIDLANSKFIVLIGSHLGENVHNSQVQEFVEGIAKGAKLVVVDPRFSTAAGKATWWLPIKPGTDMALLLSWINIILQEDLYDKEYINKYAMGLKGLKEEVKNYTPEWASKETEIPADLIVETAREMSRYKPRVLIHPGRHSSWYGDDTQRSRAMAILSALMGSWGREGGYYFPTKASLSLVYPGIPDMPEPQKHKLSGDWPYAIEATTTAMRRATITGNPYPVKGWIANGCNVMKTLPNQKETIEAIKNLDLMVVVDILPFEHTEWADVILPECTYLERYDDIKVSKGKTLSVTIRQPAVNPMYESKPSWWITRELGIKLGLEAYYPWSDIEDYLKKQLEPKGIRLETLKEKGTISFPDTANPFIAPGNEPVFNTDSKKIELYSKALKEKGFDPVPKYKRPEAPSNGYFRLIYGRSPLHTFSRTTNNQWLWELYKENEAWVSAKRAKAMGLKNGEYVVLVNQDGVKSNKIKLKATERIREDCVFIVHGFGNNSKDLKKAYKKGADDQGLITRYAVDPLMGGTGMRVNFVKIVKEA
ncbi:MAG: molybdopterin-dependent oxidoreductase [Thermodesulfovibrionales bacterium]|nr:molybdopterin-dependent oxidoreductase [Thermodesulfovibrionales bacterium]